MNEVMVSRYLQLLGCEKSTGVSPENLFLLHEKHLEHIPYTNFRIFFNALPPVLAEEALFERIVEKRQGGYCFELNGLFAALLRALGYEVTEFFARWHAGEEAAIPMRRHRVVLVKCGGRSFLADVGVGCLISCTPLEFVHDTIQERNCRAYRIVKDPLFGNLVQAESENGFYTLYSFTEDPHFPGDFEYVNYYCACNPESPFRKKLFLHKQGQSFRTFLEPPTPESPRLSLVRMQEGCEIRKEAVTSGAQLQNIFETIFQIRCDEKEISDWEKVFL